MNSESCEPCHKVAYCSAAGLVIHADIMTPYASHLNECCNVIGKGYFVASNYSADDIYEYGKFYPDAEFEERLVKAEFEFSFLIN